MNKDDPGQQHDDGEDMHDALKHVREAEQELADARKAELRAEEHLEEAIEDLEHAEPFEVKIIVNGREKRWTERKISYEQLVAIAALPLPGGPNPGFVITYHDGPHGKSGTLTEHHSIEVVDYMVFNVTPTNKS